MTLSQGDRVGPYQITAPLGAGGMGEVYRAHDAKLGRDVAVKVLPDALAQHSDRLARFEREAKVLAALNHPNIAAIYGLEDRAIVMELVEGPTLADRIAAGPIPLEEALKIAAQIADALEAAHERGITHRDLKPANIKVRGDGAVKVLDFGLATAAQGEARATSANSPTLTMAATEIGVILGTAAYMSPEQAAGKPVDKRADIWSFGVVLWEMLTGSGLFSGGETVSHTLADVLRAQIDFARLPAHVPARIRELLKRCLDRDVKTRLRDIGEARVAIQSAPVAEASGEHPAARTAWAWLWPAAAVLFFLAAAGLAVLHFATPAGQQATVKLHLTLPERVVLTGQTVPAVSPDGRHIAFTATLDGRPMLWIRDLDSLTARSVPGGEGALFPFWSPDSRSVGFFAGGKLKRVDVAGGPVLTLCDANGDPRGGTWSKDGVIVFIPDRVGGAPLFRVSAQGGTPVRVREADRSKGEAGFRFPWFLPDGRHFLYTRRIQDIGASMIDVGDLEANTHRPLLPASSNTVYAAGHLLFTRERTLMAQPFDPDKVQILGEAVPIAEEVDYVSIDQRAHFSASQNGVLVYVSGGVLGGLSQLTWFDRSGKRLGTVGRPGLIRWAAISPDDRFAVTDPLDQQTSSRDLWIHDFARGTESRFTFGPSTNEFPVWSPDGSQIAYRSQRDGIGHVYHKHLGVAQEEALDTEMRDKRPSDWSRDGQFIVTDMASGPKAGDVWILPLSGEKKPFPYLDMPAIELEGKLSPNGRWLAYTSDESKRGEVYVQTFPQRGGKWQVSVNGGQQPVWSRDGKELFFIGADGKLSAVDVQTGPGGAADFHPGVPKPLFDVRIGNDQRYDVSKDGRFLIPSALGEQVGNVPLTVVLNWPAALKK